MSIQNVSNKDIDLSSAEISTKELIIKIKEWIKYLSRHWKLILFLSLLGGFIGFTYAFYSKTFYKAELTFALDDNNSKGSSLSNALGLSNSFGSEFGGEGAFSGQNLISLMKSRRIVEKTLLSPVVFNGKKISFAEYYIELSKLRNEWGKSNLNLVDIRIPYNTDRSKFSITQDSLLRIIYKDIIKNNLEIIQNEKKISIISIVVKSHDEQFAKYFCETLANVTTYYYIELKTKKAKQNVDILQKQVDSIKSNLSYAIIGSWGFDRVNLQVSTNVLAQLSANLEISKINLLKETPLIQIIDIPILPLEKEKLNTFLTSLFSFLIGGFICISILTLSNLYKKILN